jgi:hypothetical protein
MNPRRINDILKLVGSASAMLVALTPMLADGKAKALCAAAAAFLAGIGTRGFGVEYQDVADAKAIAKSIAPPPPPLPAK